MELEQNTADNKKTPKNYVVFIDESGDLGKSVNSDPYLVFAASVTNKPEEFTKIVDKYSLNASESIELKFSTTSYHTRMSILSEINKVNPDIYSAVVVKSNKRWGKGKDLYHLAIKEFTERILDVPEDRNYYFLLDKHSAISTDENPNLGCEICKEIATKKGKNIGCKIVDSKNTKPIQAHDFVVGAIGSAYNKSDSKYVKKLKKVSYTEGEGYYVNEEYKNE